MVPTSANHAVLRPAQRRHARNSFAQRVDRLDFVRGNRGNRGNVPHENASVPGPGNEKRRFGVELAAENVAVVARTCGDGLESVLREFSETNCVVERGGGDDHIVLVFLEIDGFDGLLVGDGGSEERITGVVNVKASIVATGNVVVFDAAETSEPVWEIFA